MAWWLALAAIVFTCYATATGVNPALGLPKCTKLFWFLGFATPALLLDRPYRCWQTLWALAAGMTVSALRLLVEHCAKAPARAAERFDGDFVKALIDLGSMTDGQRLMVGMIATLGLILAYQAGGALGVMGRTRGWLRWLSGSRAACWLMLLLQGVAFVVNFKRGSWFCATAVLGCMVLFQMGRRWFILFCVLVAVVAALPQTRTRLSTLGNEFTQPGGRWTMWTSIAPELIRQHPWQGIGYRSLTNERMKAIEPRVEPRRDHLHSNPVQIQVDTGVVGALLHLAWFGAVAWILYYGWRINRGRGRLLMFIFGSMFAALLLNGLVEYNYGDAEIVLLYVVIMGAAAAFEGGVKRKDRRFMTSPC